MSRRTVIGVKKKKKKLASKDSAVFLCKHYSEKKEKKISPSLGYDLWWS